MKKSILGIACTLAAATVLAGCPPSPRLEVSTNVLRFGVVDGAYETTKTFEVYNDGSDDTTLVFAVATTEPWINVTVPSTTSTGEDDKVIVTVTIDREFAAKALEFAAGRIVVTAGDDQEEITVTTAPELFTEVIESGDDLAGLAFQFEPSGGPSFYTQTNAEITDFPTPPGGQVIDFGIFSDPVEAGLLDGRTVPFYGVEYDKLWISSEGWVSFGNNPGPSAGTVGAHFQVPRISALPVDASGEDSTITYQQDAEKVVVTYEDADTKGEDSGNDFQIEMFFDGTIRLSYVDVDPSISGVVGLSVGGFQGQQPEDFVESDLESANTGPLKGTL